MPIPFAPLTCEPDCIPSPGLHPPVPRLVTLPARRVCTCGKILSLHERAQDCCDVCMVLNRHLPRLFPEPTHGVCQ